MNRKVIVLSLSIIAAACERSKAGSPPDMAASDSVRTLSIQLAQAKAVAVQQDSVLQGVKETTQLIDEIDKELSKVKGLKGGVRKAGNGEGPTDPRVQARDRLLTRVHEVTRLLAINRARVKALTASGDSISARATGLEQTISSLEQMAERQRGEIAQLTQAVDSLRNFGQKVVAERDAVIDTAKTLRKEINTVYYVIGTKDELIKRGLITEEGARRFLLFGGRTVIPARGVDTTLFTSIDKFADVDIPLRNGSRGVQIISRHDHSLVELPKTPDGKSANTMHIKNPTQFWSASKFLIILEG
ncbi:MAG: hypothetical protein M3081_16180 [Gemmatimonadota bacterium]|nr:hypothetical protein [Gemmatimonadota bacterium]